MKELFLYFINAFILFLFLTSKAIFNFQILLFFDFILPLPTPELLDTYYIIHVWPFAQVQMEFDVTNFLQAYLIDSMRFSLMVNDLFELNILVPSLYFHSCFVLFFV